VSSKKGGLADLKRLAREAAQQAAAPRDPVGAASQSSGASAQTSRKAAKRAETVAASAQDLALFRRVAGAVAPVDTRNRLLHTPGQVDSLDAARATPPVTKGAPTAARRGDRAAPANDQPVADAGLSDADVSHLLCEEGTAFVRPGVGPDVLKKLAQRFWRLEADLDLHGMTIDQARPRLASFITQCVAYDARCVRIVHGKGYGSPDSRPVLRDKVRAWLVGSQDVRAFAQAPERDGGAGATVVLLNIDDRRARDRRAP